MNLPPALDARPKYRDLPVPFTVPWENGVPDFKGTDTDRWLEAVLQRKCALCGEPMGQLIAFIGGTMCLRNRIFNDGAMHQACAEAAAVLCPFVAMRKGYAKVTADTVARGEGDLLGGATVHTPKMMYLFLTTDYTFTEVLGEPCLLAAPFVSTEGIPRVQRRVEAA